MDNKKILSTAKIKLLTTEKNPDKLYEFIIKNKADTISFLENPESYQSNELVNIIAKNHLILMKYVFKGSSLGKNYWTDEDCINWMNNSNLDILTFADTLVKNYSNYPFSHKVENKFFELLVQEHILYKNEYMKADSINVSDPEFHKFSKYMNFLPITYIEKFEAMDSELFYNLLDKACGKSMNLAQYVYFSKSQQGQLKEAQELFNKFKDLVLKPSCTEINGYVIKTDICEYYLKQCYQIESWDFFAPMRYELLSSTQQEAFIVVGLSQLFVSGSNSLPSRIYNQDDIMNALVAAPLDKLEHYIEANKLKLPQPLKNELLSLWMQNNLEKELVKVPKIKGIKI